MNSFQKGLKISIPNLPAEIRDKICISYSDRDIVFCDNIREVPDMCPVQLDSIVLIVACIKGRLQVDINSKTYTIQKDEILFCNPNYILSNYMISPDFECKILGLTNDIIQQVLYPNRDIWNKIFYLNQNPILRLNEEEISIFEKYYDLAKTKFDKTKHRYYKESMTALIQAITYDALALLDDVVSTDTHIMYQGELLFKKFIILLSEDKETNREVGYYAKRLCVTPKYLSTVCKKQSGKTASKWIQEKTVNKIRHLLKNSEKSIKEISDELNFPNISFFGKYVKEHLGMSPTNFRKNKK